jgi:hypothetical protein
VEAVNDFDGEAGQQVGLSKSSAEGRARDVKNFRRGVLFAALRHPEQRDFWFVFFWTSKRKGTSNLMNRVRMILDVETILAAAVKSWLRESIRRVETRLAFSWIPRLNSTVPI